MKSWQAPELAKEGRVAKQPIREVLMNMNMGAFMQVACSNNGKCSMVFGAHFGAAKRTAETKLHGKKHAKLLVTRDAENPASMLFSSGCMLNVSRLVVPETLALGYIHLQR